MLLKQWHWCTKIAVLLFLVQNVNCQANYGNDLYNQYSPLDPFRRQQQSTTNTYDSQGNPQSDRYFPQNENTNLDGYNNDNRFSTRAPNPFNTQTDEPLRRPGYNQPGYNTQTDDSRIRPGFNAPGYNTQTDDPLRRPGYNQPGYNTQTDDPRRRPGFNAPGYNTQTDDPRRRPGFNIQPDDGRSRPTFNDDQRRRPTIDYNARPSSGNSVIIKEATYFVIASKMVRPGLIYKVAATILQSPNPITVRASISRDGVEMTADSKDCKEGVPETLLMRVPPTSVFGKYKLRVEGLYSNVLGGVAFINETDLHFSQRSMTIFIQTDKPVYMQGEKVRFRTIPITTELKGFDSAIDVFMLDPKGHILRRWLSRQSNLGTVSLEYSLSDQPTYGQWTVRVVAQGQIEEGHFMVEEFYQTRFEVNVTMPAFFFNTDPFIYGRIMANFTSGAPVRGNLTLKATIRPIGWFNTKFLNKKFRVGNTGSQVESEYNTYGQYQTTYGPNVDTNVDQQQRYQPNTYQDQYTIERHYNFEEEWPFWMAKPDGNTVYDHWSGRYKSSLPYLRFFNGTFDFKYPMNEIELLVPSLTGMEVMITATVGEKFYDEVIAGYAVARIYNSSIKLSFLGDTPQVFKPDMPFTVYLVAEYNDGSPMDFGPYQQGRMEVVGHVESQAGGRREYPIRVLKMSERSGIWELHVDLRNEIGLDPGKSGREYLNKIDKMQLQASYTDNRGERAQTQLLLLAHFSPQNRHIKVLTSTTGPKVGEYIIFHVRTNFFVETFHYIVMSKGVILLTGEETIRENIRTMAITLSAEMAPVSTVIVYQIDQHGRMVADSLTFPVNGISRNNFTVYINNRKARTGEKVEVAIFGEAGSYVGLSGIDNAFYTIQAGNELTYAKVITKMSNFDEQTNGTYKHTWHSHEGEPDDLVYYPSSSFGIDANRTFEFSGLLVFTDAIVPRRDEICNVTLGQYDCLSRGCYHISKKCDGFMDCADGIDELNCQTFNETHLTEFRKYRFNRIQRHYQNVWLWKDVNIGPHGRYIFNVEVPDVPSLWMISAFSISPSKGFGMIQKAIEYVGVQPFFINVEMPTECRQGEQVGIRVTVFNYMETAIESTVVLHGSPDYKFINVEEDGIVRSYNPQTFFGEQHFFVYIEAQEAKVVYIPVVPTRLGDIDITVHASTLLGTDQITRRLHVEADGLPQYRHQSILLDLSNRGYIFQYMHVNITETPIIPYEVERYFVFGSNRAKISVVGDVVGPIFPTMPVNATSLLYLPMDSAEQNMFSFAANLYTIMYMRMINQRNKTLEKNAFHHLNIGYQRQLSFMKEDGSFTLFRSDWNNSDSSVWLTAYCARIFQEASFYEWENYIFIDPLIIQKSVSWILRHQSPEGSFYEVTWYPDRKMNSTLDYDSDNIKQRNITLTAHVLITLATVKDLSGSLGSRVSIAQQKAIQYMERNMKLLKKSAEPYEVAIVAYALMLARAANAEQAFGILASQARQTGEYMYWGNIEVPQPPTKLENQKYFSLPRLPYEYDSLNIETTAYALLVYVSRREFFVEPIVRWLNAQRLNDGGWASTQDTSVALKALVEYTVRSRIRDVSSLAITIEATSLPGQQKTLYINDHNLAQLQTVDIPNAWGTVKVQAKGAGFAILQMHVQYNVDIERYQTKPPIRAFDLYTRAYYHGRNQSHITLFTCQKWNNVNESIRSGMAVLDVTIPTGYFVQQQKLDSYVLERRVRNLQRARYQERKVLFYFEFLDNEDVCLNFTIERWYPVANMSRYLPIRIYDYYAPERFNETIFDAYPTYLLNICEVCGSSQCPYCSIYNAATRSPISFTLIISTVIVMFVRHFNLFKTTTRQISIQGAR